MRRFKLYDVWISISLFAILLAWCFAMQKTACMVLSYLIIGSWQLVSMIVHAYKGWFKKKKGSRHIYHWIAAISLVTIPFGSYLILTFISPLLAAYYTWLCYEEVYVKMQRPLALLK
ncbi:MAG: hypothetical protein ABIT58_10760 [Ferruginibacter sp.]